MNNFIKTFGKVYIASGALGIDGKGYYYDKFLNLIPGHNFNGATFISKTITLDPRDGNLPLKENLQPKQKWPSCIKIWPISGHMMNAVGVSSPGLKQLLNEGIWDNRRDPFLISIIPVGKSSIERIKEIREISNLISNHKFNTQIGIQLNISCPNTDININDYIREINLYLIHLKNTGLPIDLKINVLMPINKILELINKLNTNLQIITCSNIIPYKSIPEINWKKYSGLEKFGGGGLSGPILLPYVINWIKEFRKLENIFPVKACGGIFSKYDVDKVIEVGVDAIEIGTVKLFRPHRIKSIIKRINKKI